MISGSVLKQCQTCKHLTYIRCENLFVCPYSDIEDLLPEDARYCPNYEANKEVNTSK